MADEQTNIEKYVTAMLSGVTTLETVLAALYSERNVDTAIGAQLDIIGKRVGEARFGEADDEVYRRRVRARIKTNRSRGTIDEMLAIAELVVYDDLAEYVLDNQGNAAFVMRVEDVAVTNAVADILIAFLRDAVSAGVRPIVEYSTEIPADVGRWTTQGVWGTADWAAARE